MSELKGLQFSWKTGRRGKLGEKVLGLSWEESKREKSKYSRIENICMNFYTSISVKMQTCNMTN